MPGFNLFSRLDKASIATVVFDGVTYGVSGTPVTVFTVTGLVWIIGLFAYCKTTLTGASATLALGTTNNTTGLISTTTSTNITAGKWWDGTTPHTEVGSVLSGSISSNLIITPATANTTAGELDLFCWWHPLSAGANLV